MALKRTTYAEFRQMEFDEDDRYHYELINGEIVKKSAPSPQHQRLSRNLFRQLDNIILAKKMGEIFYAPIDVFLDEHCVPQPDLVFVSQDNIHRITKDGIECVPDLVVEIISPSSVIRDRVEKKNIYERFGVKEFWLIDPQNDSDYLRFISFGE
ncbi:MAG: Uma2 family endonuclease [Emticicia sp.]|nr:Uma2 family endonuclease [Emticicia sp.]